VARGTSPAKAWARRRTRAWATPAQLGRIGEIRLADCAVEPVGVYTRTLPEGVLQFLDQGAHIIDGTYRPDRHVASHQHDPGAGDRGHAPGHLAQPSRRDVPVAALKECLEDA